MNADDYGFAVIQTILRVAHAGCACPRCVFHALRCAHAHGAVVLAARAAELPASAAAHQVLILETLEELCGVSLAQPVEGFIAPRL